MVDFTPHYSTNNPSFSSSLLDAVYRSIDLGEADDDALVMRKNHNFGSCGFPTDEEIANFRRACMIEKWMEKKVAENKPNVRRKSDHDFMMKKSRKDRENSSSSSSDSSAGFFSSSELDPFPAALHRPKPVRTAGSVAVKEIKTQGNLGVNHQRRHGDAEPEQMPAPSKRRDGGFLKTKSRAMKLYTDLKKVKQPISPGGKLAGFLNSLFAGGSPKKPKPADSPSPTKSGSTCSSASSFSRSCLSKTPSSRGKPSTATATATAVKRSVRFSLVDGDNTSTRSFHQSNTTTTSTSNFELPNSNDVSIRSVIKEELMAQAMEKSRGVEEAARDLIRNYHRKSYTNNQFEHQIEQLRKPHIQNPVFDRNFEEEDEDDDLASCGSSDLFELDNLSTIGMEELPVYETTHLGTNRAIANGFIL